ncbi:MAG UNVERIFIED_CONTAM: nitroreductase family protein [Microcystis novacekii LVE1205-3]
MQPVWHPPFVAGFLTVDVFSAFSYAMKYSHGGYDGVIEAITLRQSIGKVKPDPLPRSVIERLLTAAAQAPNHYKVRPWRFIALIGAARERLGEATGGACSRKNSPICLMRAWLTTRQTAARPGDYCRGVDQPAEAKVIEIGRIFVQQQRPARTFAGSASRGLGRSGGTAIGAPSKDQAISGLAPDQHLIVFIYRLTRKMRQLRQRLFTAQFGWISSVERNPRRLKHSGFRFMAEQLPLCLSRRAWWFCLCCG